MKGVIRKCVNSFTSHIHRYNENRCICCAYCYLLKIQICIKYRYISLSMVHIGANIYSNAENWYDDT